MESSSELKDDSIDYADIHDTNLANVRLTKDNERLTNLVNSLKHQITESCQFVERNAELERNNQKMQSELRTTKLELEDYKNRLEISLKTIEELKNKQEKQTNARQDITAYMYNADKEKNALNEEIKAFKEQIEKKNNDFLKIQAETSNLRATITSMLKVSQTVFNQVFENPDQLMNYLSQLPNKDETLQSQDLHPVINYDEQLASKITQLKFKIKKLKKSQLENQSIMDKFRQENDNKILELNNQVIKLTNEKDQIQQEFALKEIEINNEKSQHLNEIENLKKKVQSLLNRNAEKENNEIKNKIIEVTGTLKQENTDLKNQLQELRQVATEKDRLLIENQNQAKLLMDQRINFDNQKDIMKKKFDKMQEELQKAKKDYDDLEIKYKSALLDKDSQEENKLADIAKFKSLESSLAMAENIKFELESQNKKLTRSVKYLEENVENSKSEISKLSKHRDKLVAVVGKQNLIINSLEKKLEKTINENKSMQDKILETRSKLIQKATEKPQVIEIPISAWFSQEFSRDLCNEINKVANSSIEIIAKLKSIMNTIGSFYNNLLAQKDQNIKQITDESKFTKEILEKIIANISISLDLPQLSYYYFYNDCERANSDINKAIEKLASDKQQISNNKQIVEQDLSEVVDKLSVKNKDEAMEMIDELFITIDNTKMEIKSYKKQIKQLKKLITACTTQSDLKNAENQKQIKELNEEINKKNEEIMKLSNDLNIAERKIKTQERIITDIKDKAKNDIADAINSNTKSNKSEEQKYQKTISNLKEEKMKIKTENEELRLRVKFLENDICQLKGCIMTVENARKRSDDEVSKLMNQFDSYDAKLRNEFSKEKENQKSLYEKHITELKLRNTELAEAHTVMSNSLNDCNLKITELSKKLLNAEKEIDEMRNDSANKIEELTRSLNVANAKIRSITLSKDMEYQNAIDDIVKQSRLVNQSLIDTFVFELRDFIDPHAQVNIPVLSCAVKKAHEELNRLYEQESKLRSILGLGDREVVEDYVSKLVLSRYLSKK